jgi:hypothetical protein
MSSPFQSCGINYANPSTIGGTGSGVKIFPSLLNSAVAATLQILEQQQGQIVVLNAAGNVHLHGTSPTIIPTLQSGSSLTSTNNTTVSALTSAQLFASTGATYPWALQIKLQGDQSSGIVQVVSTSFTCNGVNSTSFTNTSLTGVSFSGASAGDGFKNPEVGVTLCLGLNFGVSDAANAANLYQFELES